MSLQKTATFVASLTAFFLMLSKFVIGMLSGSISVLSSAIDSLLDMFVSIFNYFAVHNSEKKADKTFNYGRGKIEAIAGLLEGIVITLSGLFILYAAIQKIVYKEELQFLGIALGVMIFSTIVTGVLVYFLEYVAKKTESLVIQSDALHYKTDLYSNLGILLALLGVYVTGWFYIDAIIGIIISFYIIYSAWELIKKGYLLLLDISIPQEEVDQIVTIIKKQALVSSYHELRTRQSGKTKYVELHLVFNPDIKLIDAHRISDHVEYSIPKINEKYKWKVMIHMDPYDDSEYDIEK